MSQPENQIANDAPVYPEYGAPSVQPQVAPEEPAKLNWFQRLTGVLFSPGETFADVNRKPTIIAPLIITMLLVLATITVVNWKLGPYMDDFLRRTIKKQAERSGATLSPEQMEQQVEIGKKVSKFTPIIGAVAVPITYAIIAGLFALGMMMIQAKTTYKKIFSVVLWTFAALGIVGNIVFWAVLMVKGDDDLRAMNPQDPTAIVPTNVGAFLGPETSPALKSIAGSLDILSFWTIAVLSIGLAAIAGSRKIKPGKTAVIVIVFWVIYVIGKAGIASLRG